MLIDLGSTTRQGWKLGATLRIASLFGAVIVSAALLGSLLGLFQIQSDEAAQMLARARQTPASSPQTTVASRQPTRVKAPS